MLNFATLSTLRNSERSEISPYLKVNKLVGNNFIDNGKKPKTPASEKDFIIHGITGNMNFTFTKISLVAQVTWGENSVGSKWMQSTQ